MPPRHWQSRRHPFAIALWPVAKVYGCLHWMRTKLYDWGFFKPHTLPVPVVVVGNVMAGGVGKTPIVMALVQRLQAMGYKPGVVSRGYGRTSKECQIVTANSTAEQVGDEPLLIARTRQVPVAVAANRVQAAKALRISHPECNVIVSDDGLQHLALKRDIEIVVCDERGTGNGWLLPAGPLREPWPRQARSAVHLMLQDVPRQLAQSAVDSTGQRYPLAALSELKDRPLHAIAGIAKPQAFFAMLTAKGLLLTTATAYADHDSFATFNPAPDQNALWLCTEKDALKLWHRYPHMAWQILAVPLEVELNTTFLAVFDATMHALIAN
ncbi:MAG: tetraacyldisaccharide 4'-kinase [Cytophagales bacterium]|nr:tetraacyldisaccharide 4'-kinase [Cytophagales bacterium]